MPRIASTAVAFTLLLALHIATVLTIAQEHQERNMLPQARNIQMPIVISHR